MVSILEAASSTYTCVHTSRHTNKVGLFGKVRSALDIER